MDSSIYRSRARKNALGCQFDHHQPISDTENREVGITKQIRVAGEED